MEPTAAKRWPLITDLLTIYIFNEGVWCDGDGRDEMNKRRTH